MLAPPLIAQYCEGLLWSVVCSGLNSRPATNRSGTSRLGNTTMTVLLCRMYLLFSFLAALVVVDWCLNVVVAEQDGQTSHLDGHKLNRTLPEEGKSDAASVVQSRVPSCLTAKETTVCDNRSLPLLVFAVGVEGSGHHLVEALFGRLSSYYMADWSPGLHLYDPDIGISDLTKLFYTVVEKDVLRERFRYLEDLFNKAKAESKLGVTVIVNSFPMGLGSGMYATARPDLLDLKSFECQLYRIKFLVIRRHPLAAVLSSTTRFRSRFTKYGGLYRIPPSERSDLNEMNLHYSVSARITEDNLIYIDQQVRRLGCHQVFFVDNDKFVAETTRHSSLQALAAFLELNASETSVLQSTRLRAPKTKIDIPPLCDQCIERTLYEFFEERKTMWPLMNPQ